MTHSGRDNWGSRIGFVLAAAGSAVGLGNLWKFPYLTWDNNGGAFVLVYLLAVVIIGLPLMMSEILVGRSTQLSPVPAFTKLGGRRWSGVGWLGVASGAVIQSYYMVIAGWSLRSFVQCLGWSIKGYVTPADGDFDAFLSNGSLQIGLTLLFTLFTAIIVYRGIGGGIEKATKVLMPALLAILLYLVFTTFTMEGRNEALAKIFIPDFSKLPREGFLEAVGQAFFSLSLGLGAMIAYGSYLGKKESIFKSALWVVVLDTIVALLCCIAMFTIIYSVPGLQNRISGSTIGMLFITLPDLFYTKMPGGILLGPLFFVLVAFAALSSTISLGEVTTSLLIDQKGWRRSHATLATTSVVFIGSILAALSLGASGILSSFSLFEGKEGVLSTLDHLAANWMLPTGGFLITLFVGWKLGRKFCMDELGLEKPNLAFTVWLWIVRVVAPAAVLILLINVIMGKDFS
ncbi:MAG: sodium-dependent transporter [Acidobacteria bacterium]|nr:sodium-dependent transporter [Acidobacteriota bacterium]